MSQDAQRTRQEASPPPETDHMRAEYLHAGHTTPYDQTQASEAARGRYGATEDENSRSDAMIAPTFSDTEPGAGPNYGAAGDPDAPSWGGLEDQTTLGPGG